MILGIGVDAVEIKRFIPWTHYAHKQLARIFSEQELIYCFNEPTLTAQRLALRFAAREAFFKALTNAYPAAKVPFLTVCRNIQIIKNSSGSIHLTVDWTTLNKHGLTPQELYPQIHLTATHTRAYASAWVIIEAPSIKAP